MKKKDHKRTRLMSLALLSAFSLSLLSSCHQYETELKLKETTEATYGTIDVTEKDEQTTITTRASEEMGTSESSSKNTTSQETSDQTTEKSEETSKQEKPNEDQTEKTTHKPTPTTERPKPTNPKLTETTHKPTPTTEKPKPTTHKPTPTTERPKPTEPKPTNPKPTTTIKPTPTTKPTETTHKPNPTTVKPTPTPKPTEPKPTETKPTPTTIKPTPTPKPTEPKPTEPKPTEPKPTETQIKEIKRTKEEKNYKGNEKAYTSRTIEDPSQKKGTSGIRTKGENGYTIYYQERDRIEYSNGSVKYTDWVTVRTESKDPVQEVKWIGTKEETSSVGWNQAVMQAVANKLTEVRLQKGLATNIAWDKTEAKKLAERPVFGHLDNANECVAYGGWNAGDSAQEQAEMFFTIWMSDSHAEQILAEYPDWTVGAYNYRGNVYVIIYCDVDW